MINWRDRDRQLSFIGLDGLEVESLLAESKTSKFDLTLMLTEIGDEIGWRWNTARICLTEPASSA